MGSKETRQKQGRASYARGTKAELLCRVVLRFKLYRILACRYKTPHGEIDIVAARGRTLVFIEVKARPDETTAAEAISMKQRERLARAADAFLASQPRFSSFTRRFDAMLVLPRRWPRHVENAFL